MQGKPDGEENENYECKVGQDTEHLSKLMEEMSDGKGENTE